MSEGNGAYTGWAILSLMGHRRRVGIVGEAEMYGGKLLRIDIPCGEGFVTEYYGTASIYSLEPITEEIARKEEYTLDFRPVNPLAFRDPTPDEIEKEVARRAAAEVRRRVAYAGVDEDRGF